MAYHIINIDTPQCSLTCRDGQLVCKSGQGGEKSLPLEDVAAIVITSHSAQIHSHLLLQAAKLGVALIICETFKPASLVLPANRSSDTLLTRVQSSVSTRLKESLWKRTIDAKCANQASLACQIAPDHPNLRNLQEASQSRHKTKEATCARLFWGIFGSSLSQERFIRDRATPGLNSLLNYGYAVLLSTILQKLLAVGLDPTFGIAHATRERSTPLAFDLMEPFRPCVDWRVHQWASRHPDAEQWSVTPEYRAWVTAFPIARVGYLNFNIEVRGCIEGVVRSFRRALIESKPTLYKPWKQRTSKWDGSS